MWDISMSFSYQVLPVVWYGTSLLSARCRKGLTGPISPMLRGDWLAMQGSRLHDIRLRQKVCNRGEEEERRKHEIRFGWLSFGVSGCGVRAMKRSNRPTCRVTIHQWLIGPSHMSSWIMRTCSRYIARVWSDCHWWLIDRHSHIRYLLSIKRLASELLSAAFQKTNIQSPRPVIQSLTHTWNSTRTAWPSCDYRQLTPPDTIRVDLQSSAPNKDTYKIGMTRETKNRRSKNIALE